MIFESSIKIKKAGFLNNFKLESSFFQIHFYSKRFSVLLQFLKEQCLHTTANTNATTSNIIKALLNLEAKLFHQMV